MKVANNPIDFIVLYSLPLAGYPTHTEQTAPMQPPTAVLFMPAHTKPSKVGQMVCPWTPISLWQPIKVTYLSELTLERRPVLHAVPVLN